MNTSLSAQPNKPTSGTSEFSVSPVESPEYIDAAAEETCPAASAPTSEPDKRPQGVAGEPTEAPSVASLEVMDQLKALAQNVTQSNQVSSVQSNKSEDAGASDPGGSQATEPSISVFPRPTGFESNQVINDRPKFGTHVLILAGFVGAALIGAGGTFAWQAHLKSDDVAMTAAPAPVAAAPALSRDLSKQLEALSQDISSVRRDVEEFAVKQQQLVAAQQQLEQLTVEQQQLAAKQDQVGQTIAKLQALEQARQRAPAPPVQSRAAPVPPRPSVPPPPIEPTTQPPSPPRTAAHPIPPLPVPSTR